MTVGEIKKVVGDDFDVEEEIEATQNGGLIEMQQPAPQPVEDLEMPDAVSDADSTEQIPA